MKRPYNWFVYFCQGFNPEKAIADPLQMYDIGIAVFNPLKWFRRKPGCREIDIGPVAVRNDRKVFNISA